MFNPDFFPTPDAVIEKMLAPLFRTYKECPDSSFFGPRRGAVEVERTFFPYDTVLDPSAGSGSILDYVSKLFGDQNRRESSRDARLYCFETDPTLQATLQGKNYRLLGHDFLKYSGDMPLSCIVMNPPFSAGDAHVLHAYHIVAPGGQVVALLNSETLRNPHTRTRQQLLRLIEQVGGTVEELGACFQDSERPTNVDVSIIRLQKPEGADRFSFNWENKGRERAFDTSAHKSQELAGRDVIGNMLTQYDCLREQFLNLLRAIDGIKHFGAGLSNEGNYRDAWRIASDVIKADERPSGEGYARQYTAFTEEMRQQIWGVVMQKVNIQKFMTNAVRESFSKFNKASGYLDFTRENVFQLVSMVLDNTGNILEVAIGQLFDKFTEYHKENRCHVEGWLTNSRYKVNRKLILPNWVEFSDWGNEFHASARDGCYSDVDKVMCYLTGERYEDTCLIGDALALQFRKLGRVDSGTFENVCYSRFFKIRFFKKGTIHLEFLDARLHEEFNLRACAGKQWLPAEEQQAYQTRKTSPFPKAQPAPGTAQAAGMGGGEREEVLQLLLGSAEPVETAQLSPVPCPTPEPAPAISSRAVPVEEGEPLDEPMQDAEVVEEPRATGPVHPRPAMNPRYPEPARRRRALVVPLANGPGAVRQLGLFPAGLV